MTYTLGGPELLARKPETIIGSKDDAGVYVPVEAKIRILLRCPDHIAQVGVDVSPDDFEPQLRHACAVAMHGLTVGDDGFVAESVCVQEFAPGGP